MKINKALLEKFKNTDSKILVVTKYLEKDVTFEVVNELEENYMDILE
jgi:late competence protein required for DNA uptake (superfamily II DNA/RNA helicase)